MMIHTRWLVEGTARNDARRVFAPPLLLALAALLLSVPVGLPLPCVAFSPAPAATINALRSSSSFPCLSNWSNPQAWDLGRAPISGDDVVFGVNPLNPPDHTNYDLAASVQLHSLTIASSEVAGCNGIFVVTGGPIGLQSGGSITDNWCNGGTHSLPGVTLNGSATFTLGACAANQSTLSFDGAVTGTGPLTFVNNGSNDALRLTVASTYSGATTVDGTARVRFDVNGAVPTGSALTVNGSALFMTSSTIGSLAGGGNVFMNGNNTLTVGGDNTSTTFSGVYQNSGGNAALTKTGTGTLTLSGANTYTGVTTVNAGTLAVNGSLGSDVAVNNGGTLGGTGTIKSVGVDNGGTLSPGNSPGIINTGVLILNFGGMLTIELNGLTAGTQYDQVNVSGEVGLDGFLNVVLGFSPNVGDVFTIIKKGGPVEVLGTFFLLPEGATFCVGGTLFRISYVGGDGNDVTLTVIADTTPPQITCPPNQTAVTNQNTCAPPGVVPCQVVTFPAPTASDNCPGVTVMCNPPSGSCFPTGTTTVTCTATDASSNTASCSFAVTVFDVCLQDDSNPARVLLFNSLTGDYRFCCSGTTFTGKGKVTKQGCIFTLEHNPLDRRVRATADLGVFRGNASLQSPPGRLRCTIMDSDIRNNACACQ